MSGDSVFKEAEINSFACSAVGYLIKARKEKEKTEAFRL